MSKTIENYTLLEKIGQGQYGNVYRAQNRKNNQFYAMKVMNVSKFKQTPKLSEFTNNEIAILSKISHPNIIRFVEMLRTVNNYYLVYELCNGGTLSEHIKASKRLPEPNAIAIFLQLRSAFTVLYSSNILHRDLKPTNILFHNGIIKLADFGFCKELLKGQDMTQTIVGSPIYMAPQVLKGQAYDSRADEWSLGVILYEMLYGVCPYEECTIARLISLFDTNKLNFPEGVPVSDHIKQYLRQVLTLDVSKRMPPAEFIEYPLFKAAPRADFSTVKQPTFNTALIRYVRKGAYYMLETIEKLAVKMEDIHSVIRTFLALKAYLCFTRDTSTNEAYWERFNSQMDMNLQEIVRNENAILRPLEQKLREVLARQDSLKIKIELSTQYLSCRYYLQCTQALDDHLKMRALNSLLYYQQLTAVLEGKQVQLVEHTEERSSLVDKEAQCRARV